MSEIHQLPVPDHEANDTRMNRPHRAAVVQDPLYSIAAGDLYDAIALQIERENMLINQRLSWTLQLNGFMFTAVAIVNGKALDPIGVVLVQVLVPLTGLVVSVAGMLGVLAADSQIAYLKQQWQTKLAAIDPRPRPFGRKGPYVLGKLPGLLPPGALAIVWAWCLAFRYLSP